MNFRHSVATHVYSGNISPQQTFFDLSNLGFVQYKRTKKKIIIKKVVNINTANSSTALALTFLSAV